MLAADPKKALDMFERACTAQKHGPSCTEAAHIYSTGRTRFDGTTPIVLIKRDHDKALKLWERGCDLGDGAGCQRRGTEVDDLYSKDARKWFERGCTQGDGTACAQMAFSIENGKPPDAAKAKPYFARAKQLLEAHCKKTGTKDGRACWVRGYFFEYGMGGYAKDPAQSLEAFRLSCAAGFSSGCPRQAEPLQAHHQSPR